MSETTVNIFGTPDQTYHPDCTKCPIHKDVKNVGIGGDGPIPCDVMVIGEVPYRYEDAGNMPFHPEAPAGKKLRMLCDAMFEGYKVRYENVVRCATKTADGKPRKPSQSEIRNCLPYLNEAIMLARPKVIILCGLSAIQSVMGWPKVSMEQLRGKPQFEDSVAYVFTYHPSNMIPKPWQGSDLSDAERFVRMICEDFEMARKILTEEMTHAAKIDYDVVENENDAMLLLADLARVPEFAHDIESNSYEKTPIDTQFKSGFSVVSSAFSWNPGRSIVVPYNSIETAHCKSPAKFHPDYTWQRNFIHAVFDLKATHIGQNYVYDLLGMEAGYGIDPYRFFWDTMLIHHLLYPHLRGQHGLKKLAHAWTPFGGYERVLEAKVKEAPVKERGYYQVPFEILAHKNAYDAAITFDLYQKFRAQLEQDKELWTLYHELIIPTAFAIMDMSKRGLKVDPDAYKQTQAEVWIKKMQYRDLLRVLPGWAKSEEALGRPLDLGKALDQILLMYKYSTATIYEGEIIRTAKTGLPSTKKEAIDKIAEKSIEAKIFQQYKRMMTTEDKVLDAVPRWIGADGRIHPQFVQTGTSTGRFAGKDPNSQQFPNNDEEERDGKAPIKDLFVPEDGYIFLYADISQAEVRMLAHVTQDPWVLDAVKNTDVHRYMAAGFYKKDPKDVTNEERGIFKRNNFAIIYGATAWKVARLLGISEEEAQEVLDGYWKSFPGVKSNLVDPTTAEIWKNGEVRSIFGRKWVNWLDLTKAQEWEIKEVMRQAINFKIQSPTHDMVSAGLRDFRDSMKHLPARSWFLVNEVHDSCLVEIKKEYAEEGLYRLKYAMEHPKVPFELTVDWIADVGAGYTMNEIVKLGKKAA